MAEKWMRFPWQWTSDTLSTNFDVIWGMSVEYGVDTLMIWWAIIYALVFGLLVCFVLCIFFYRKCIKTENRDTFISYGSENEKIAREIRQTLEEARLTAWMYNPNEKWPSTWLSIANALRQTETLIFVPSRLPRRDPQHSGRVPASNISALQSESTFVRAELDIAARWGLPIFQIINASDVHALLAEIKRARPRPHFSEEERLTQAGEIYQSHFPEIAIWNPRTGEADRAFASERFKMKSYDDNKSIIMYYSKYAAIGCFLFFIAIVIVVICWLFSTLVLQLI